MRKSLQKINSWLMILLFIGGNLNCFHAVFLMLLKIKLWSFLGLVVYLVNKFSNCSYGHNLLFFILRTKVHFALSWFTACSAVCAKSWWPLDWSHASLILFKNAFKQQLLSKTINTVRIKKKRDETLIAHIICRLLELCLVLILTIVVSLRNRSM